VNVTYQQILNSFPYDYVKDRANTSRSAPFNSLFYLSDAATVDGIRVEMVPFDYVHIADESSALVRNLTADQVMGFETIKFTLNIGQLPYKYKRTGRLYLEVGLPFNRTVPYVPEAYRKYVPEIIDLIDYREPPSDPVGSVWMLLVFLGLGVALSAIMIPCGIIVHRRELRAVVVKRHEFLQKLGTRM
jgi:hypothetical protein